MKKYKTNREELDNTLKVWDHVALYECTQDVALKKLKLSREDCGELLCEYSLITRIDVCIDCVLSMVNNMCAIKAWSLIQSSENARVVAEEILNVLNTLYQEENYG